MWPSLLNTVGGVEWWWGLRRHLTSRPPAPHHAPAALLSWPHPTSPIGPQYPAPHPLGPTASPRPAQTRTCTGRLVLKMGPSAASCGTALSMSAYSSAAASGAAVGSPAATAPARPCGLALAAGEGSVIWTEPCRGGRGGGGARKCVCVCGEVLEGCGCGDVGSDSTAGIHTHDIQMLAYWGVPSGQRLGPRGAGALGRDIFCALVRGPADCKSCRAPPTRSVPALSLRKGLH